MPKVIDDLNMGFAACRLGIRKCWQWMLCNKPNYQIKEQYEVLCLGMQGAGKSTVLASLVGEPVNEVIEPTTGFNIKTLPVKDTVLNIKELGGSENVRPFWNRYFSGQHGILFVIDSSEEDSHFQELKEEMQTILNEPSLKFLPCIVIGTHQDSVHKKSSEELKEIFGPVLQGRLWHIITCSMNERDKICNGVEHLVDLMNH